MGVYDKLYSENMGLLWYWAKRYSGFIQDRGDIATEDLIQAGFLGLCEASATYQPDKGAWSSWASNYIRKTMRECIGLRGKKQIQTVSLDTPIGEEENTLLVDMIADDSLPDCDANIMQTEISKAVREAVNAIKGDSLRQAVQRVYLNMERRAEVARALNVTESTLQGMLVRGKREMRNNWRLRRALTLDDETRFHAHKGVTAFNRDMTSVVEEAVIWRVSKQRRDKHKGKQGKGDGGAVIVSHGKGSGGNVRDPGTDAL